MTEADRSAAEAAPHETSLAVWDLPSPLVVGRRSTMKVGVKCAAGCDLTGRDVEICDHAGARLARATLGTTPWPGTGALYWTEIDLVAPAAEGACYWTVRMVPDRSDPHRYGASNVRVITVRPPEHHVTVKVLAKETAEALDDVEVRVGMYRARTDAAGVAHVAVPKGAYELHVWRMGCEGLSTTIDVRDDLMLSLEVAAAPQPELEYWK